MSAISHHEISVSVNGKFYFRTDPSWGHHTTEFEANQLFKHFTEVFPEHLGYRITQSYWTCTGRYVQDTKGERV